MDTEKDISDLSREDLISMLNEKSCEDFRIGNDIKAKKPFNPMFHVDLVDRLTTHFVCLGKEKETTRVLSCGYLDRGILPEEFKSAEWYLIQRVIYNAIADTFPDLVTSLAPNVVYTWNQYVVHASPEKRTGVTYLVRLKKS